LPSITCANRGDLAIANDEDAILDWRACKRENLGVRYRVGIGGLLREGEIGGANACHE
jgi:hypothetical protein